MEEDKVHPLSYPLTVHTDYSLGIRKWCFPNKNTSHGNCRLSGSKGLLILLFKVYFQAGEILIGYAFLSLLAYCANRIHQPCNFNPTAVCIA